jgi:16S rRNA (adenine1518-N6/adenine1519-N6)-dimethyltransferase
MKLRTHLKQLGTRQVRLKERLTDIANIKYLLTIFAGKKSGKHRLGQNFLTSEHALDQIIKTAEINEKDTIIEIGPGLGVLTYELTKRAKKVIAIEMDPEMVHVLKNTLIREPTSKNLTVIEKDALNFDPETIKTPYKLVANLPYNVATPLLKKFLVTSVHRPSRVTVLVQKEVAEKACANTGDHSVLSLTIQPFGRAKIIAYVPPSSFYPAPKVTSAILLIEPHKTPLLAPHLQRNYFSLIHAAFGQKRKTLLNSLQSIIPKSDLAKLLSKANINPVTRPQELAVEDWIMLSSCL